MYALHIYTDSLASIQAVKNAISHPHKHKRKLHSDLVGDVANLIICRAKLKQHTHLHKVKSHYDVDGNEHADKDVKEAVELDVTAHAFGPRNDYPEHHHDVPTYWMTALTPSVAHLKLAEREVCM